MDRLSKASRIGDTGVLPDLSITTYLLVELYHSSLYNVVAALFITSHISGACGKCPNFESQLENTLQDISQGGTKYEEDIYHDQCFDEIGGFANEHLQ